MIITKYIKKKITSGNMKNYHAYGKMGDTFYLPIKDLPKCSHQKIDVKCENCGNEKEITYQSYIINTKDGDLPYYCSNKECINKKRKMAIQLKYGCDNVFQLEKVKEKIIETNLEKYGCENPQQNKEIKEKTEQTCLEKYGVDNPSKNKDIINKIKNIFLEKYGVSTPFLLKKTIDKRKKNCLEKYGEEYILNRPEFQIKSKKTIKERYGVDNPSQIDFVINNRKIKFIKRHSKHVNIIDIDGENLFCHCNKGHKFEILKSQLYYRLKEGFEICTICNTFDEFVSNQEKEVLCFINDNINTEIIENSKSIISPYELDIYLPKLKLAFEFNGLYWHNELNKPNNYHKNKIDLCKNKEIQLIHIWEDDWKTKKDIIKSMILNKLEKTPIKIFGRKCKIKEINNNEIIRNFLNKNHLQGYVGSSIKIGLFYNNEVVSLMLFKKNNEKEYELVRYCNKINTNIIGGASKLFNYFIKNYKFNSIKTFADRSFSSGKIYETLGFNFDKEIKVDYSYIINNIKYHKFNFRKHKLVEQGFDINKSEKEIMRERKIYRIYDSGKLRYYYIK